MSIYSFGPLPLMKGVCETKNTKENRYAVTSNKNNNKQTELQKEYPARTRIVFN
jgi:hypothetical protein